MSRTARLSIAIDTLAGKLENGHLLAASDSAGFLTAVASEIDRLTRELAEAKARAVIPNEWVAVPVEPDQKMKDTGWSTYLNDDSVKMGNIYRAMLSARPDLPSKESGNGE